MRIAYDSSLKVGGIGISPWTRLGPERWFPNYRIASFFGPDEGTTGLPPIYSVYGNGSDSLVRYNSLNLLKTPAFQTLLEEHFNEYKLFTYKPTDSPAYIEQYLLRSDEEYANLSKTLENKAEFRRLFASDVVRFPDFKIISKENFMSIESVDALLQGRTVVIVQDAEMSGGKGTLFVNDKTSFLKAKEVLAKGSASEVVVSEAVSNPSERSVQCVATKQGIFMGPTQVQIIDNPLLVNGNVVGAEKFCGVVIDPKLTTEAQQQAMRKIAGHIGEKIVGMGYRGIFGIDFLVDDNGEVYVLEVNPRITGATPLLTAFYSNENFIPFYLLHILEIMKQEYVIEQADIPPGSYSKVHPASLMILHSQETIRVEVVSTLRTGIYSKDLIFVKPSVTFDDMKEGEYLIESIAPSGFKVGPAGRLLTVYYKGTVLDESGRIDKKVQGDIASIYANIKLVETAKE